jgi:DNA invertase Pin-like site-specific DNA recombinase
MGTVILYARASTIEQGLSLEAQRGKLEAEASYRGWDSTIYLEDAGQSARTLDRPAMRQALGMLASGEATALCAVKLDRISRSVVDFVSLLSLSEQQRWSLVVLDLALDTSSANGRFVAQILASVAELERNLISERTKVALAAAAARGTKVGRPVAVPSHIREFVVRARGEGYSLSAIANTLSEKGVPTAHNGKQWYSSTIRAILASA